MIGAQLGGWLSDKIGRRLMFLLTMILFIILAVSQAFVTSVGWLVAIRVVLGVPLGSDITTGYAYIMESMSKGEREIMGNRWQFMFAVGNVLAVAVVTAFLLSGMSHEWIWRLTLGLGALPALIILLMRHDLPETAVWLVRQGRFREAKQAALQLFNDPLDMLPDADVLVAKPHPAAFLADLRKDPIRWRATLYGWISGFCQAAQFQTFGFYLPVLFAMVGVSRGIALGMALTRDSWLARSGRDRLYPSASGVRRGRTPWSSLSPVGRVWRTHGPATPACTTSMSF